MTGDIEVKRELDREEVVKFIMTIVASDNPTQGKPLTGRSPSARYSCPFWLPPLLLLILGSHLFYIDRGVKPTAVPGLKR